MKHWPKLLFRPRHKEVAVVAYATNFLVIDQIASPSIQRQMSSDAATLVGLAVVLAISLIYTAAMFAVFRTDRALVVAILITWAAFLGRLLY